MKIKLPQRFIDKLINLPEHGIGYQIVKIKLKGGTMLDYDRIIINSTFLLISSNENINPDDIEDIELLK